YTPGQKLTFGCLSHPWVVHRRGWRTNSLRSSPESRMQLRAGNPIFQIWARRKILLLLKPVPAGYEVVRETENRQQRQIFYFHFSGGKKKHGDSRDVSGLSAAKIGGRSVWSPVFRH